ncbi:PREDICTED: probable inactive shikimate kinase like 2, chloroplastic [Lupinus angustifolius]|uniref:probable inactive shikimate kinase like 2, chloroplastic n=1 Tax=Lupinus angustifolius TaxID=3871 RepID=UPI00092ED716|nr:PREDICTED: probable inactive shikimate kinase like 2, chloroplastic [Lupinus angustifolius]
MASTTSWAGLWFLTRNTTVSTTTSTTSLEFSVLKPNVGPFRLFSPYSLSHNGSTSLTQRSCKCSYTAPVSTRTYEFSDTSSEVELRLNLKGLDIQSSRDISVDTSDSSLAIRALRPGLPVTLIETNHLFDRIKPSETIWYIDDDELVVNFKKHDPDLKWPDIMESWESLTAGSTQLLKGASIYLVGNSTEINYKVAQEIATGLGYTPLSTKELLETYSNQTVDSWLLAEGSDSVAEAESAILESISSHVRAAVATLGGQHGASGRTDKWRHLYAGFTVWLSQTEATDEDSAKEETRKNVKDGRLAYTNADVVVKLQGWDSAYAKNVAQACLSALKQLILSDKKLPGKKSLYIRLGCRGDWPNIKPPGWDPLSEGGEHGPSWDRLILVLTRS